MDTDRPDHFREPPASKPNEWRFKSTEIDTSGWVRPNDEVEFTMDRPADRERETVVPERIGRYVIRRRLGEGGYGAVYLGYDEELDRLVAIKAPRLERFSSQKAMSTFIAEARAAARLRHSHIVTVYDVIPSQNGLYIVLEYIDGRNLKDCLLSERPNPMRAVEWMIDIARAVDHAHQRGLVHRDLKPSNVLLDADGHPHVADFGLALQERGQFAAPEGGGTKGGIAGTPVYMAPEQVRGETHRLDGRTDIWGLGVILYVMLTGRPPFTGATRDQLFSEILHGEPKPPRQFNRSVSRPLERICLRCLAKRMGDRYSTAMDLADDLEQWKNENSAPVLSMPAGTESPPIAPSDSSGWTTSEKTPINVIPKGLRSFDETDADFFLELLPGPYDRNGLPECIRFWKTRIEETKAERTFSVGLLYGPSGSGKSSLVKAGLIPLLSERIHLIYLDASPEGTEARLIQRIRAVCPNLPAHSSLAETCLALREGSFLESGEKVVVVLDQIEQWLNANRPEPDAELIKALRHCDGGTLQCLLMVRDDFGMAAMRLMHALEVPVVQGENYATVDRFDIDHARKVLKHFGRAFGRLGAGSSTDSTFEPSSAQNRFIEQAVDGLAQDGQVVPVRLALFAEMFRSKVWTPASLKQVGGAEGIGVAFLESALGDRTANPKYRLHRRAARQVLSRLLPEEGYRSEGGREIKGRVRSERELQAACGYENRPADFEELIGVLEHELRLIMLSDPENDPAGRRPEDGGERTDRPLRFYQLTHEYLIPSLRDWLTRKQRETMRGRAYSLLQRRAALWAARPERRYLPSLSEWIRLRVLTRRSHFSDGQSAMMRSADRVYLRWLALATMLLVAVCLVALEGRRTIENRRQARQVDALMGQLLVADMRSVPQVLDTLDDFRPQCAPRLRRIAQASTVSAKDRLRAHLALVRTDEQSVSFLVDRLIEAEPETLLVIRDELQRWQETAVPLLWQIVTRADATSGQRLRAACALAALDDPHSSRWGRVAENLAAALVSENPLRAMGWVEALRPVRFALRDGLSKHFADRTASETERTLAASILADFEAANPDRLAALLKQADTAQHPILLEAVSEHRDIVVRIMEEELTGDVAQPRQVKSSTVRTKTIAAMTLLHLGEAECVWPLLRQSTDPTVRTLLIENVSRYGVPASTVIDRLAHEEEPSARQAILLILGDYAPDEFPQPQQDALWKALGELYTADPDPGVHSAAQWLLKRWGKVSLLADLRAGLQPGSHGGWWITPQGHTLTVIEGPVTFRMGSPPSEPDRVGNEDWHTRRIDRSFALGTHEVTVEQFLQFRPNADFARDVTPSDECPINKVSWYDAVAYCRWLSEQQGVPEGQMCYPPLEEIGPGMTLPEDMLSRTGYRLPTEAEWEYACRAGAPTSRFFGRQRELRAKYGQFNEQLLAEYGWFNQNSQDHLWSVSRLKPNPLGLFDVYGNVMEWCQGPYVESFASEGNDVVLDDEIGTNTSGDVERALRSGGYTYSARRIRSAARWAYAPKNSYSFLGFRIARTIPPVQGNE